MPDDTTLARSGTPEGIALVHLAQDSGDWKPVVDWLAKYPEFAEEVARFIGDAEGIGRAINPPVPISRTGSAFGGIELKEILGGGSMGVVHRGYDPVLKRDVAVKIVRSELALSAVELARFRLECEIVASLGHRNIVPVMHSGDADGVPFMIMPLIAGGSLAEHLKSLGSDRRMDEPKAAMMVRDVAIGIEHAHDKELIHRDLKPANILLDGETPMIADFGIARRLDVCVSTNAEIAGTIPYMAPEQARGDKNLTTSVDIHALGAILFELLTGRTPFGGGHAATILRRIIEEQPPTLRNFRPELSRDLEAVCLKCLEKNPAHRYATAQALAEDLDRFIDKQPVLARPRGVIGYVHAALNWERETSTMASWKAFAFGAVNHLLNHGFIAVLVYLNYQRAAVWAVAWHLFTWAAFLWMFGARKLDSLNDIERIGTNAQIGAWLAIVFFLPFAFAYSDIAWIYPGYNAVIGAVSFGYAAIHRGRHYLFGTLWLAQNLVLPALPVWCWPLLHCFVGAGIQVWIALTFRKAHRAGQQIVEESA